MSAPFCNPVTASPEDLLNTRPYPLRYLNPTVPLVDCASGAVNITGQCAPPHASPILPVFNAPQITEQALREALNTPKLDFTVTLYHPYGKELMLAQFVKINSREYRIVQWNVPNFTCCHSRVRDIEMYDRLANGDQATKLIAEIIKSERVLLPHEPVPIVFETPFGKSTTVYLL